MIKILVVDDDLKILKIIKEILIFHDYSVSVLESVDSFSLEDFVGYDLIILDIMMPGLSGDILCKKIRDYLTTPIIFLTAKVQEEDLVKGLGLGADDYITKPFRINELLARISSVIRREREYNGNQGSNYLTDGLVTLSETERVIRIKDQQITLTYNEYEIIALLMANPNKIFSVDQIYAAIYPMDSDVLLRAINEYVYQIRRKFKKHKIDPILTVREVGYRWKVRYLA